MNFYFNNIQKKLHNHYTKIGVSLSENNKNLHQKKCFSNENWKSLTEEGIWGLGIEKKYDGDGLTWFDFCAALEGLSTSIDDLGFLLSIIAHIGAIRAISIYGTEQQKKNFLPRLISGEIACTAITELSGGSDVANITSKAIKQADGKYILNGRKTHITNSSIADIFLVVTKMPHLGKKRDVSLFIFDKQKEGIDIGPVEKTLGNMTSPTADILLNNIVLSDADLLGQPGNGLNTLYDIIALDRLLYGLIASAFSQPILKKCLLHCNERYSFGKPIAEHQYIQNKLVDIKIHLETSRLLAYSALHKLLEHADDASIACSIAKLVGSEGLVNTALHYVQIFGHEGYMESQMSQFLCDAIGTRIAGGTSEIQRINIYKQMQKIHKDEELNTCKISSAKKQPIYML